MRSLPLLALPLLIVGSACHDSGPVEPDAKTEAAAARIDAIGQPLTVAVPFKAIFSVWDGSDYTDQRCGPLPMVSLTMVGKGTATSLGAFTTRMTFCANTETSESGVAQIVFEAANGDRLYAVSEAGQVVPNEGDNADKYPTRFDYLIHFVSGTGRFEGASGSFHSNGFCTDGPDLRTDFWSEGTLVLVQGRR